MDFLQKTSTHSLSSGLPVQWRFFLQALNKLKNRLRNISCADSSFCKNFAVLFGSPLGIVAQSGNVAEQLSAIRLLFIHTIFLPTAEVGCPSARRFRTISSFRSIRFAALYMSFIGMPLWLEISAGFS